MTKSTEVFSCLLSSSSGVNLSSGVKSPSQEDELEKYKEEIEEIRNRGYSISNEEVDKGVIAYGAPIFNHDNEVAGAIAIANIVGVLSEDKLRDNIEQLLKTAKQISNDLGSFNNN